MHPTSQMYPSSAARLPSQPNQYGVQPYPHSAQYPNRGGVVGDPFTSPRVNQTSTMVNLPPGQMPRPGEVFSNIIDGQRVHERVIREGTHLVHEKVIELPKKVVQEKIVEVPQVEIVTKYIDVPEIVYQEKIVQRPVEQIEYREVPVPRYRKVQTTVEVPEIVYIDQPYEKIVEVPEYQDQFVERIVEVPQYIEIPVPEYRDVPVNHEVERHLPVPVEVTATFEYRMPCIRPVYKEVPVPIYVPRYIEVPVPAHMMDSSVLKNLNDQVNFLSKNPATSPDDLQRLADLSRSAIPSA